MRLLTLIRARLRRQLSVQSLGANEARVLYDAGVSTLGLGITVAFSFLFLGGLGWDRLGVLCTLPVLLLFTNGAIGIYSRLRTSSGRVKAIGLLGGAAVSGAVALVLGATPELVVLWLLVVYPPLALARLLLGLPFSRHRKLISVAVNHRGPILVIGGAGYIGSHTVDQLLQKGHPVRVLDRLMYGQESLADFIHHPRFQLIEGDATDIAKLTLAMKDVSAVVHLGGLVGDPACALDPVFTRHANIVATRMAREVAQATGIHRFVFASSCSVYGVSDKEVSENHQLNPVSLYAQTKIDSEKELLSAVRDEFVVTILRFATVFGHSRRPRFDLVGNLFTAQAMTDGLITVIGPNQWRPFIHVRDLARAIVLALGTDTHIVQNQIFNVGDQRMNMTIMQLAENVQNVCVRYRDVAVSVRENAEDLRNYAVSFTKIRSMLGFQAATLMEPGISEMAEAFQNGLYHHYREQIYSNLAVTKQAVTRFYDPAESSHLYGPLRGVHDAN
jgi:nucleoside-diphosphate-sugar epimerase